ncbi:hypothetical protein ACH4E7_39620 [Kitasatospora sp. NPDC018058]|uniref:hypothetical protein n=1 Tax=Kitasatospora sp. NPDC018058 TaxID=3364025 RepID=UPI0037C015D5
MFARDALISGNVDQGGGRYDGQGAERLASVALGDQDEREAGDSSDELMLGCHSRNGPHQLVVASVEAGAQRGGQASVVDAVGVDFVEPYSR